MRMSLALSLALFVVLFKKCFLKFSSRENMIIFCQRDLFSQIFFRGSKNSTVTIFGLRQWVLMAIHICLL